MSGDVVVWAPHKFTPELLKGNWVVDTVWLWDMLGCGRLWAQQLPP